MPPKQRYIIPSQNTPNEHYQAIINALKQHSSGQKPSGQSQRLQQNKNTSQNDIWSEQTSERVRIRQFWLNLKESERAQLIKLEKEQVFTH